MKKLLDNYKLLFLGAMLCITQLAAAQSGFIKGRVSDETGHLPGVNVMIEGPTAKIVFTNVDGAFSVQVLSGKYTVSVDVLGYGVQKKTVTVREGLTSIANFALSQNSGGVTASASLFEQTVLDAPATVHVFSDLQIRNRGYNNIQDLLEDIPEAEIQRKSMVEFKDNIGFRGITGNEKFIIFQDGVRITAATGDPHTVHTNYPLNNVKSVEVLVGPASAVYGVDAFSGLINIITKKGDEIKGGRLMGSYGMFNTTDNSFIVGQDFKGVKVAVSGNYFRSNEPNFNEIYTNEYDWFNNQYFTNGNVVAAPFPPFDTINLGITERDFQMPSSSYFINSTVNFGDFQVGYTRHGEMHSSSFPARPEYSLYTNETQYGFNIESLYGRHSYSSEDKKLNLTTTLSYNAMENNVNSLFMNTYTNYNKGYKYQFGKALRFEELLTYELSDNINLASGVSLEDISALPKTGDLPQAFDKTIAAEFQNQFYFGSNITDKDGNDLTILQDFYYLQYRNIGGFVQFQTKGYQKFQVTAGIRYDYNTRYGSSFNPRVALLVKPTENLRLKLMYNEAFLSPSPWKAYQHFGSFVPRTNLNGEIIGLQSFFFHLPNPDLRPEKLRSIEGAISYSGGSNWFLGINTFANQVDDVINYFTADNTRNSFQGHPVFFVETPSNTGQLITYGGTARIEYKYEISPESRFNVHVYYTFMDGLLDEEKVPYTAKHTVRLGMTYYSNRFVFSPRASYRTASFSILQDNDGNTISNDAYLLLNAHIGYHLINNKKSKITIFADVFNALNSNFYGISNIGVEGFALAPQDPLRAKFGVDVNF